MPRFFNNAGPCLEGRHYMIPPERRIKEARRLIEQGLFFVLHAPRQSGKTTWINTLARHLNAGGTYTAVVVNLEPLQMWTEVGTGLQECVRRIALAGASLPPGERPPAYDDITFTGASTLETYLSTWATRCSKPIVLLIDEIDSLPEDLLISVLRQLRAGYSARPAAFIHSLALVGLRDVRDYKVKLRPEAHSLGTASPFNIKADSLVLKNFTREEVAELYGQHTLETGQEFTPGAMTLAFDLTQGQPWLVSALARQITEYDVEDRAIPITAEHIEAAKEALILRRDTHLDSLVDKLREERVRQVIEPILVGRGIAPDVYNDSLQYCADLGMVALRPNVRIANPIYQEIIPRALGFVMQVNIVEESVWYTRADGSLDMAALLKAFQGFFRQNSEAWLGRYDYKEAGPHLLLMAFMQRVINGGGQIQREFAIGSGRADLYVGWRGRRYVLELKLYEDRSTEVDGLEQISRYLDRVGEAEAYLILFDRRPDRSWEDKIYQRQVNTPTGRSVTVVGC